MSEVAEVKTLLDQQMRTFEALKAANEGMQAEIKKFGEADGLTKTKLAEINAALDKYSDQFKAFGKAQEAAANANERLDRIETALKRSGRPIDGANDNAKALEQFNVERKSILAARGKMAVDATAEEFDAYKTAFVNFVRKGDPMTDAERKALSVGSDPDGGYTVTPDMSGRTIQKIFETSPIRQIASVQSITTDALEGVEDRNEGTGGWVAETGTRAQSNTPQMGRWRIPVHEMYSMPAATQQILDDSGINIEQWLADKVADKLARIENAAFVEGNGVGQPRGFLDYSSTNVGDSSRTWGVLENVHTGTSASYGTSSNGADKLVSLVHKLKAGYRTGAVFVMNRATLGTTRTLKDGAGQYIWLPSMTAGQNSSLLGYPVVEAEDMDDIAADSRSVAFGNFRLGYQIVDRQGIRVLRDPYSSKPYVLFYTTRRVGGAVLHPEAIKFLKFSA
jgi:HK97 family phage major capsid protein